MSEFAPKQNQSETVFVRRSDGSIEDGWKVEQTGTSYGAGDEERPFVIVRKKTDTEVLEKTIYKDEHDKLQQEKSEETTRLIGGTALSEQSVLITSAPGFEAPSPGAKENSNIAISKGQFKGDPSKVIGHPSNPATEPLEAYSNQMKNGNY